ncbi:MAG: hypothetical protein ACYDBV_12730 [Nitrospiria bacterium]
MKKHDPFNLFWKSRYSIRKDTVEKILKEIDDEIKYISVAVIPTASGIDLKKAFKNIEQLKEHKDAIQKKFSSPKKKKSSSFEGTDLPTEVADEKAEDSSGETEEKTYDEERMFARTRKSLDIAYPRDTIIGKNINQKKNILINLYMKTWGSQVGLEPQVLEKMSESDVDIAINTLQKIFGYEE